MASAVVVVELVVISWIRNRYMDTPFLYAVFQVVVGGFLVFLTGILDRQLVIRGSLRTPSTPSSTPFRRSPVPVVRWSKVVPWKPGSVIAVTQMLHTSGRHLLILPSGYAVALADQERGSL